MDSKTPIPQCTRPAFVGITPLAMETTQRYLQQMQNQQAESKPSCLKLLCFILLIITAFNTLFISMTMYKNAMLIEENRDLLGRIFSLEKQHLIISGWGSVQPQSIKSQPADTEPFPTLYKFAKMIDDTRPREDCPPCTTPKPTPIETHKNPVSILNEEIGNAHGQVILYECVHSCVNPPIHNSYLTINKTELVGKQWVGIGESKTGSKQAAAYLAIKEIYPHLESAVGDEYIPEEYHPICKTPNPGGRVEGGKKC